MIPTTNVTFSCTFQKLWNSITNKEANKTMTIIHAHGMEENFMDYADNIWCAMPKLESVEYWLVNYRNVILENITWEA